MCLVLHLGRSLKVFSAGKALKAFILDVGKNKKKMFFRNV